MNDAEFNNTCKFIATLGRVALQCGVSSFRLESQLNRTTAAFGIHGDFLVTPQKVASVLWREGDERQRVHVTHLPRPGLNMAGVARLSELVDRVESGELSVEAGTAALEEIQKMAPPFGPLMIALSFGLIGAGFAVLLSLPWPDIIIGTGLSMGVFALVSLLGRSSRTAKLINPLAAFLAAFLAHTIAALWAPGSKYMLVALCAVIALVPNPGLVLGIGELSSGHFISGASRLLSAVVTLIELAFGAFLGTAIASTMWSIPKGVSVASLALGWAWPAIAVLGLGLAILFQVRLKEHGWVLLGCLLAWMGVVIGGKLFGSGPGDLLGALALGIYANLYAHRRGRAVSVILLPCLMVLAPGYASYLGLGTLQTSGVDAGLLAQFKVFVTLAWITGGLFIANTIISPNHSVSLKTKRTVV